WRGLVLVVVAIEAFQRLTGTNGIFFYSNPRVAAGGSSADPTFLQTLIPSLFKIAGVTARILPTARVGRQRAAAGGGPLIFVSRAAVATVFTVAPVVDGVHDISADPVLAFLAVAALCCFLLGFTSSWGPIFSIVMGEMFPNQIRGGAMSIASGADF